MRDLRTVGRDEALAEIPDTPTTLEFRDLALDRHAIVNRSGSGWLLIDAHETLVCAVGAVLPPHVQRFYSSKQPACELLADRRAFEALRDDFSFTRATISLLDRAWSHAPGSIPELTVRPLRPQDTLDHLPIALRRELTVHRRDQIVFAGFLRDTPVSFACAMSSTESYSDISIDTLRAHRRRGFGREVVSCLIDHVFEIGKTPVWGAAVDNAASLALAASLGFTRPAGELFVCKSPSDVIHG